MGVSSGVSHVYTADVLAPYALNNLEDAEPLYVGKATADGTWLVMKLATTSVMTYANKSNNPAVALYTDAWANRATLTYGAFQTLTGV